VTTARRRQHAGVDKNTFEKQLEREILVSERLRVTILAAVFAFSLLVLLVMMEAEPHFVARLFRRQLPPGYVVATLGFMLLYELATWKLVTKRIAEQRLSPVRRYLNALVETSFPTAGIVLLAQIYTPGQALLMPPVFGYFLFVALSTLRLSFRLCLFTSGVAALEYMLLVVLFSRPAAAVTAAAHAPAHARGGAPAPAPALDSEAMLLRLAPHQGKALFILLCGVACGFVAVEMRRRFTSAFRALQERDRVQDMFGRHVSQAVAEKLLTQKRDASELRYVCVMFLDIRGFTTYAEGRPPKEVVRYLNQLFTYMIEIVNNHDGFINKFLGDGFMAVFGAPISEGNEAQNAVDAALEILSATRKLVADGTLPATRLGIGLHAGKAVTGNVGSALRKEYTIIGDVVNVASRIEMLNKQFGSQLLISGEVRSALGGTAPRGTPRGPVAVKGRAAAVEVYQLA
jgi:adenylate cyclase